MRADTFYSAPIPQATDTVKGKFVPREGTNILASTPDTVVLNNDADTSKPRYFIGYHHVKIYNDSLQGICDSLYYSQKDSLLRLMIKKNR